MKQDQVFEAIYKAKKIIVTTGAGVSVSCGIPDFRSENGLYQLLKARYPNTLLKGQELFDASLFNSVEKKEIFYHFIASLKKMVSQASPSKTHNFFKSLQEKGVLARVYTQNIDDLDERTGLKAGYQKNSHVVQLHGDLTTVKCTNCSHVQEFHAELVDSFYSGKSPACPSCVTACENRVALGKRSITCGILRPNIVLYNEFHSNGDLIADLQTIDLNRGPDLLIVIGTSLKIVGVKRLIKDFAEAVHSREGRICIFLNMTPAPKEWDNIFDYQMIGPCDESIALIEEKIAILANEEARKKSERASARIKREQKMAREKAATSSITKYFKQVKPATALSKPSGENSMSVPKSRPDSKASSSSASSKSMNQSKPSSLNLKSNNSKKMSRIVDTAPSKSSNASSKSKTTNPKLNSKGQVLNSTESLIPKLDTFALSPQKQPLRDDIKSKSVTNPKSKLPTPVKKKKEPFKVVLSGNEQQLSPTKKQKKLVSTSLIPVELAI